MKYQFKSGDLVSVPKRFHTETSMEEVSKERLEGVYVRYCGDSCGMIRFEDGRERMYNVGWMKPVKKISKKVASSNQK